MAGKKGGKPGSTRAQTASGKTPAAGKLSNSGPSESSSDGLAEERFADLLDQARELPQDGSALWVVATRRLEGVPLPDEQTGQPTDPWLVIVLDARSGQMLHAEPQAEPTAEDVTGALLLCMLEPGDFAPKRPGRILSEDGPLALSLHMALAGLGVRVERQDLPGLQGALDVMAREVQAQLRRDQPLPFLSGLGADEVKGLVTAFSRFLAAEPWTVFAPDRPVYASWTTPGGERAGLYATLMGELGQEFGLALYPDWLSYARHVANAHDTGDALEATGGLEALTLSIAEYLHPDDLSAMRRAGLKPGEEPGLLRVGPHGVAPPLTPVVPLSAVLNLLSARAERQASRVSSSHVAPSRVISLKAAHGGVQLRYPAGPADELSADEAAGSVRVSLSSGPNVFAPNVSAREPLELVFTGPAGTLLRKALRDVGAWLGAHDVHLTLPFRLSLLPEGPGTLPGDFLRPPGPTLWQERTDTPDLTLVHLTRFPRLTDPVQLLTLEAQWQPQTMTELSIASGVRPGKSATMKPTPGKSAQRQSTQGKSVQRKPHGTWVKTKK